MVSGLKLALLAVFCASVFAFPRRELTDDSDDDPKLKNDYDGFDGKLF
jgi:hypothetical protein